MEFSDSSWAAVTIGDSSIEFNMGDEDPCQSFMLHVRGGPDALVAVSKLLTHLNLRGIDMQTSRFFDEPEVEASFKKWSDFRDSAIAEYQPPHTRFLSWLKSVLR